MSQGRGSLCSAGGTPLWYERSGLPGPPQIGTAATRAARGRFGAERGGDNVPLWSKVLRPGKRHCQQSTWQLAVKGKQVHASMKQDGEKIV